MTASHPYAVPNDLPANLVEVGNCWRGLLRGSAAVPFADDLDLDALKAIAPRLVIVDVFEKPERFRFAAVGKDLAVSQPHALEGRFLDEVSLVHPFEFLRSQCSATVESAAPTCHSQHKAGDSYSRLMLPFWGEGHISLVLVAFDRV